MRKVMLMLALILAVPAAVAVAELRVPQADAGADFIGDVEAVLAGIEVAPDQAGAVEQAKKTFMANKDKLLADLMAKFTEQVGQAEEVFGALDAEETPKEEKKQLDKKVKQFGSTEGRKFQRLVQTLRSAATGEIARALGQNGREFRSALRQRQPDRAPIIGRNALGLEAIVPKLGLDAERTEKFTALIQELRNVQKTILADYQASYAENIGERDEVRRINKEGTDEEKAELRKKISEWRKKMTEVNKKKSEEAVEQCRNAIRQILTEGQAAQFDELSSGGK